MHINSLSGISEHPLMADESAVGAINRPLLLCQGSCDGWGPGGGKPQSRATIGGSLSPCQCTAGSMVQHYRPEPFASLRVNSAKQLCAHRARSVAASSLRPELRLTRASAQGDNRGEAAEEALLCLSDDESRKTTLHRGHHSLPAAHGRTQASPGCRRSQHVPYDMLRLL